MIRQTFNDGWRLSMAGGGLMEMIGGAGAAEIPVQIPHDAMIWEKPDANDVSGSQTGFYPGGQYTYLKNFDVPAEWEGKDVFLEFEGVYMTAMVYINGSHAATNLHGYAGFYVQAKDLLHYGATNEIKVIANNPTPNSRWYSGSGIYRSVNLLVGDDVHFLNDGVRATTKLATAEEAIVEIESKLVNLTRTKQKIAVKTMLCFDGSVVKEDTVTLTLFAEDKETVRQNLRIAAPALWNIDTPNLYDLKVEILSGDTVLDTFCDKIGLRTLTLDAEQGLRINGVVIKQKGTCIHHDNGVIGAATFADAEERRARQMKEAGFNAVRSAHHPMSPEMLRACDKYGLVVMDELSDVWYEHKNRNDFATYFDLLWEQEIERIVAKDYNHPCVILYSTGNEILDLGREIGGRMNRKLCNKFHELDNTRFTTTAINGMLNAMTSGKMPLIIGDILQKMGIDPTAPQEGGADGIGGMNMMMSLMNSDDFTNHPLMTEALEESAQAADVAGFNYLTGRHGTLEAQLHPNKPVLGTETFPGDIVRLWGLVEDHNNVLGDYTWTGYDYLGEAGCGIFYYDGTVNFSSHFPDRIAYIGDIDIIGTRRPISYLRETVFGDRKAPYIGVIRMDKYGKEHSQTMWMYKDNIASWTWPGFEGQKTEAEVYSVDDEVELFINGVSQGRKPAGRANGFTAIYEVTYEPGEIVAVSYKNGVETGRCALQTAGSDLHLDVQVENEALKADGQSLAFLTAAVVDANGVLDPWTKKTVKVEVEGAGALQGFGSGEPQPTRGYQDPECPTYDGRVMAVIRAEKEAGPIRVTFTAEGLAPVTVTLQAE